MNEWKTKPVGILLLLLVALFGMNAAAVNNPVSYESQVNDCDVFKYNGEYYMQGNWLKGDMLRSRDLESWGERKHIFSWANNWHNGKYADPTDDIQAGNVRYYNGVFHLYTQLEPANWPTDLLAITHATADNPWGPYTEVDLNTHFSINIDAETFLDENGSLYFHSTHTDAGIGNRNFVQTMSDPYTLTGSVILQTSGTAGWENNTVINEGPKVVQYRNRYYMLYAAYPTSDPRYAIGCVEASSPTGFTNNKKYNAAVCKRTESRYPLDEIAYIGQPWVVDGLNGFEKWMGYFAQTTNEVTHAFGDGRTQRIDRMHFFDRTLFIDGPTDRWTPGYHPGPAKPQLLNTFPIADGALPSSDWNPQAGTWSVANEEAQQTDQNAWAFNTVNRDAARNYLIEANLKFTQGADSEDKAGVLAFYQDANNYVLVGLNRATDDWYMHVREGGVDTVTAGNYGGSVNYGVYHKIRVTKNLGTFDVRIDDMIPPGFAPAVTGLGVGLPGIYTDHTAAAFDGIVYTIGWDEYDSGIAGWGPGVIPQLGTWTPGSTGITMADGTGYIFKGDLMQEFEFSAQVYKEDTANGRMGLAIAVDTANYLIAKIKPDTGDLIFKVVEDSVDISPPSVNVGSKTDYNIRVVKLSGCVIVFVDGVERQSINVGYGPAQAGLYVEGMSARFNGIMAYRTEPTVAPSEWTMSDVGTPGFAGSIHEYDHALYMTGSGADVWGTSDEFAFAQKDISGDWEFTTRVVANDKTHYYAKAGLMFRESTVQNSRMVHLSVCPRDNGLGGVYLHSRDGTGANVGSVAFAENLRYPIWIKLKRNGSLFTGSYSSDGQSWTPLGSHTSPVNDAGKLGFSVCSLNNDRINKAVFDNVTLAVPVALNPGTIGNSQVIYEDETPAPFTSLAAATGNNPVSYQWEYKTGAGGSWVNLTGDTNETYTAPNMNGTVPVDTELFLHRKATDAFYEEDSNEVSLMVKKVYEISEGKIFIDNFNVSDSGNVNSNYATRQDGGGVVAPYTYGANYSITNNKLKNLNGDLALNADMARYIVGEDFEFSFKVAKPEAGGLTSIFLFDGTDSGDRRGDSHFGMYIDGTAGWACVLYKGTGATPELDIVVTSEIGGSYDTVDEHTFQFISHAGTGETNTYDLVIDGVEVRTGLPYYFDGPERRIGMVGSMNSAGALYDDISINKSGPTSSGIDLRAYQAAAGTYVEFVAYNVEEDGSISLALLDADGSIVWQDMVDVTAGPRFVARFLVPGLVAGESYDFAVTDEVGQGWAAPGVVVGTFETEMVSLSLTSLTLSFNSLQDREYGIQWVAELGGTWQTVDAVTAAGNHTSIVVDYPNPEDPSGFFRVQLK